jgi:hypothetical protein
MQRGVAVLAAVVLVVGLGYSAVALTYPRGTLAQPGPAIYAMLIGGLLVIAALGTLVQSLLAVRQGPPLAIEWPTVDGRVRIAGIFVAAFAYLLLVGHVGHLIAAFLTCALVLRSQGEGRLIRVGVLSAALSIASYYAFIVLLGVRMPGTSLLG